VATMTILLRKDPQTGKQNVIVKLDSDPDALPHEHEQMHKKFVRDLVGKNVNAEDLGEIIIEREPESTLEAPATNPQAPERQKTSTPG
jgi:hypothetical protein